jgi:RNA polymerase sigma-70 factor (ECF subfamily)
VRRIALRTCIDGLRRQKARPEYIWGELSEQEAQVLAALQEPERCQELDPEGSRSVLERLLARLSPKEAWLLRTVELEQKSLQEVCEATGWNKGAARVRLFRARRKLELEVRKMEKRNE